MNRAKKFYIIISAIFVTLTLLLLGVESLAFLRLSDLSSNWAEQKYRIQKLAEQQANLQTLDQNYHKVEPDLDKINQALPEQKDSSKLLSDLDSLSSQSGLKLTVIQADSYGKKGVSSDPSLLQTVKGKYSYELPVQIRVAGSYQGFTTFISRIENYQRLLNITGIEISKASKTEGKDKIEATLKVNAYLLK